MRGGDPRAPGAAAALQTAAQQQRGYRNEKLHLLAKQKRLSASDEPLMDKQAAPTGRNAVGRSLPSSIAPRPQHARVVKLTSVLQQAPQHFDRVKVSLPAYLQWLHGYLGSRSTATAAEQQQTQPSQQTHVLPLRCCCFAGGCCRADADRH